MRAHIESERYDPGQLLTTSGIPASSPSLLNCQAGRRNLPPKRTAASWPPLTISWIVRTETPRRVAAPPTSSASASSACNAVLAGAVEDASVTQMA